MGEIWSKRCEGVGITWVEPPMSGCLRFHPVCILCSRLRQKTQRELCRLHLREWHRDLGQSDPGSLVPC